MTLPSNPNFKQVKANSKKPILKFLKKEYLYGKGFWHYFGCVCVWFYKHDISPTILFKKFLAYQTGHIYSKPNGKDGSSDMPIVDK